MEDLPDQLQQGETCCMCVCVCVCVRVCVCMLMSEQDKLSKKNNYTAEDVKSAHSVYMSVILLTQAMHISLQQISPPLGVCAARYELRGLQRHGAVGTVVVTRRFYLARGLHYWCPLPQTLSTPDTARRRALSGKMSRWPPTAKTPRMPQCNPGSTCVINEDDWRMVTISLSPTEEVWFYLI